MTTLCLSSQTVASCDRIKERLLLVESVGLWYGRFVSSVYLLPVLPNLSSLIRPFTQEIPNLLNQYLARKGGKERWDLKANLLEFWLFSEQTRNQLIMFWIVCVLCLALPSFSSACSLGMWKADPADCGKFRMCVLGRETEFKCPDKTVTNQMMQACVPQGSYMDTCKHLFATWPIA